MNFFMFRIIEGNHKLTTINIVKGLEENSINNEHGERDATGERSVSLAKRFVLQNTACGTSE